MSVLSNSNAIPSGGGDYFIEGSTRFDPAYNQSYQRQAKTHSGGIRTYTLSFWVKRGELGSNQTLASFWTQNVTQGFLRFNSSDQLQLYSVLGSVVRVNSTFAPVLRDTTNWYHIVLKVDSTQATASDRVNVFINGEKYAIASQPTQNQYVPLMFWTNPSDTRIGARSTGHNATPSEAFEGFMTEWHYIDGQALDATEFGEYDDNNTWKPKEYTGTYGTNGNYLKLNDGEIGQFSSYYANLESGKAVGIADNAAIEVGSGDFCIEGWFRPQSLGSSQENWVTKGGSGYNAFTIGRYYGTSGDGTLVMYGSSSGSSWDVFNGEIFGYVTQDVWHHLAFYRIGNNFYGAVNGYVRFIKTYSGAIWNNSSDLFVGNDGGNSSDAQIRVSNFRLVKGNSVYTSSNFTPPTSALTAITGTGVLTFQDSTFVDNSGNSLNIYASNGTPTLSSASIPLTQAVLDSSGNNNNVLPVNFYVQKGSYNTQSYTRDVPTLTDENTAAYPSMYPLQGNPQYSSEEAGWSVYCNANDYGTAGSFAIPKSGKWYWECRVRNAAFASYQAVGIASTDVFAQNDFYDSGLAGGLNYGSGVSTYAYNGQGDKMTNSSTAAYGSSWGSVNDFIGVAVDMDAGKIWFRVNGVWQNSGDPVAGTNAAWSIWTDREYVPIYHSWSAGNGMRFNFGQYKYGSGLGFQYGPPTGFKQLNTYNLPDTSVLNGKNHMNSLTYTGDGGTSNSLTYDFSPDLVWSKSRSNAQSNILYDSIRGTSNYLLSNSANAEATVANPALSFDSNGHTWTQPYSASNFSGYTYVNWVWRGSDSAPVSNTDGTITSTVSANPTAGFSIVKFTGNGAANATTGHGLSGTPDLIIHKRTDTAKDWLVSGYGGSSLSSVFTADNQFLLLNSTSAKLSAASNTLEAQSTTIKHRVNGTNASGSTNVMYCFKEIEGFSKIGSYEGNGSADGTFVYTGFRPAFVLFKNADDSRQWGIIDAARSPYNQTNATLEPSTSNAENPYDDMDFYSNGFKPRTTDPGSNRSGYTIIYMAFAENPFKNSLAR